MKKAIVLVNIGTPNSPSKKDVRKYLRQFLNDKFVIDIPLLARFFLVNFIIIPFRAKKSASLYQKLWTENGSPLAIYLKKITEQLQLLLPDTTRVFPAMRYGKPSFKKVIHEINTGGYNDVVLIPLFPQYASSTTGSTINYFSKMIRATNAHCNIQIINQFYSHPAFVKSFVQRIREYQPEKFDFIVFSYHGLPLRQIRKHHKNSEECDRCNCENQMPECGYMCYKATCYNNTRLLASELNFKQDQHSTSFQSRLSKNWLSPFTDKTIIELAKKGYKNILIVSPSFVADCLETIVEIKHEYAEIFKRNGGEQLTLVESLNDSNEWINCLKILSEEQYKD